MEQRDTQQDLYSQANKENMTDNVNKNHQRLSYKNNVQQKSKDHYPKIFNLDKEKLFSSPFMASTPGTTIH